MVRVGGFRQRHGRPGGRGADGSDEAAAGNLQRGAQAEAEDSFPATIPPRHEDTAVRPAGHSSRSTEGIGFGGTDHGYRTHEGGEVGSGDCGD